MPERNWFVVLPLLAGCGAVDPRPEQEQARRLIQGSTGESAAFDPQAGAPTAAEIEDLLADGLGLAEAARFALLNNRRLQAGFARLGVAKAELVQAGLLRNPSLSLGFLFPSGGGGSKLTLGLAQSVVELWQLPQREELARADLAREVLELSRLAGELVADVRAAYLEAVAVRELAAVAGDGRDLARRELEAVQGRVSGGVATEADASLASSAAASAEHAALLALAAEAGAKERLAALLSLEGDLAPVELVDPLPDADPSLPAGEELVAAGLASRLDLRASAQALAAAEARLGLERRRVVPEAALTLAAERPELGNDPDLLLGPGASLELPLFDTNRARTAAAAFELEERRKEHEALVAEVAQTVRAAADRAAAAAVAAGFAERELLPRAEHGHALARQAFELGAADVLAVLAGQRAVLDARRSAVEGRREAALARIELERALGAPLGWR